MLHLFWVPPAYFYLLLVFWCFNSFLLFVSLLLKFCHKSLLSLIYFKARRLFIKIFQLPKEILLSMEIFICPSFMFPFFFLISIHTSYVKYSHLLIETVLFIPAIDKKEKKGTLEVAYVLTSKNSMGYSGISDTLVHFWHFFWLEGHLSHSIP